MATEYPLFAIMRRSLAWTVIRIAVLLLAASLAPSRALALEGVSLPGSIKPVEAALPAGPLNPNKPAITSWTLRAAESGAEMRVEVSLKMRNFAQLEARVAHGEKIAPGEITAKYEPLPSDYDAVVKWLTGQGLTITRPDRHHTNVFAKGTVTQVQQAFQVTFARVAFHGKEYTSAITAPSVPAGLAPLLVGVNGLQPHLQMRPQILRRQAVVNDSSGSASYLPKQIATAYGAANLYNTDIVGSGQTIAIVIDTFPATSDLVAFWKDAGIKQSLASIQFVQAVAGTLPDPEGEETLDTEWSSSMAPRARVRVYAATDFEPADEDAAYSQVYDDVTEHPEYGIHQMSMSYGYGEEYVTDSQAQTDHGYFVKLAAVGVTLFASSGDDGSTPGVDGTGDNTGPVQVLSPASDPDITSVGGTSLQLNSNNTRSSEIVWNAISDGGGASGGGISMFFSGATCPWQTGVGVTSGTNRQVPDVAASADPQYGAVIVLGGEKQTVGGTSWSSPTWAAFCALFNQARADLGEPVLGMLNPNIYPLLSGTNYSANYAANFNDITSGNNATPYSGGLYSATTGYDLCTGLGTPHVDVLAQFLTGSASLIGVQSPNSLEEVTPGQSASFTVNVSGASATYQWQIMPVGSTTWSNLSDSGTFTGSLTSTLAINGATSAMSGDEFQCQVTVNSNVVTTTPPSVLIVDTPLTISTLAGEATVPGFQNAKGTGAEFNYPSGVAVDGSGNLYVADYGNNVIRQISPSGFVSSPYGNVNGYSGDGNGSGNSASFNEPNAVAIDGSGNLYVADSGNNSIRKISDGVVSTLATGFNGPEGVAVDGSGNVYVANSGNDVIDKITPGGAVSLLAGQTGVAGFANGDAIATAEFNNPISVAVDSSGDVFVADFGNSVVREITGGQVTTAAGSPEVNGWFDGPGAGALFNAPIGVSVDGAGNLYISDSQVPDANTSPSGNCLLRKLSPAGVVSTLAGDPGISGAINATGTAAEFYSIQAVTVSGSGEFYIADSFNQIIRSGTAAGIVTSNSSSIISLSGDLAFDDVTVGETGTSTFTITDSGSSALTVTSIAYPDGFSGNWSSGVIASGSSQTVTVIFAPTAITTYGGLITVNSDAGAGVNTITASGVGVAGAQAPTATTAAASIITDSSALLNGTVNPEGALTTAYFQYGTDTTYASGTTASIVAGSGATGVSISEPATGLAPATEYHYRAVAASGTFMAYGNDETFTTQSFLATSIAYAGEPADDLNDAEYAAFGNPAINALDDVAFQATLHKATGVVTANTDAGIWAQDSTGTRHLVARTGSSAPGTASAVFSSLDNPVYNDSEAVAFFGKLRTAAGEATASTAAGIWSSGGGSLALVARQGSPAPGYPTGVKFSSFSSLALLDQGSVVFSGAVNAHSDNHGIWSGDSAADLQLLLKEGDMVSSVDGPLTITSLSFLPTVSFVNGQSRSFSQSTGELVCLATFGKKGTGIVELAGTNASLITLTGSAAPGVASGEFAAFGNPAINASGDIAFRATLEKGPGGVTGSSNAGIWAQDSTGTLDLIARTGSSAAGTSAVYATLTDPVYNDNSAVAFRGTLHVTGTEAKSSTAAGVWSNSGGSLALVARQGSQAPGCLTGATFSAFTSIALPDQGGVVMLAGLNVNSNAGVTGGNNAGIWAVDSGGNLQLIVRKGSVANGKTIASISFLPILPYVSGQTRDFAASTGDIAYLVTFTDKTTAIFLVTF